MDTLQTFKRLGVRLAIDDFGTGYSNLGYLRRFPIDRIKIDKSFVQDIQDENSNAAIAAAIIAMARCLRLDVTAEGVETKTQLTFLQSMNCNEMQGFFFSQPCPAEHITALLRSRPNLETWVGMELAAFLGRTPDASPHRHYARASASSASTRINP